MNDEVLVAVVVGALFFLLHFVLLARVSHWAHATQQKLDTTNNLLRAIAERDGKGPQA